MTTQVKIADEYGRSALKKVIVHDTETPNAEARIAIALIEKWGMVAAKTEGEDSAGRAVLKELLPAEIVSRACQTAELAMAAFREKGWLVAVPDIEELTRNSDG